MQELLLSAEFVHTVDSVSQVLCVEGIFGGRREIANHLFNYLKKKSIEQFLVTWAKFIKEVMRF